MASFYYFDLGNVLLRFDHGIACENVSKLTGLDAGQVREIAFRGGMENCYERGDLTSEGFYDDFFRVAKKNAKNLKVPSIAQFLESMSCIFESQSDLEGLVRRMHAAGHRLGVLSNTCEA